MTSQTKNLKCLHRRWELYENTSGTDNAIFTAVSLYSLQVKNPGKDYPLSVKKAILLLLGVVYAFTVPFCYWDEKLQWVATEVYDVARC